MANKYGRTMIGIKAGSASLVGKYCRVMGIKVYEYISALVEKDLAGFKKDLEKMRQLN